VLDRLQKHFKQLNGPFDLTEAEKEEQSELLEAFMGAWARLCQATTEEQYEEHWPAPRREYNAYPELISYIRWNQYPQREYIAKP
jgi:FMN phosphatase YigB (HAD superfamily)